MRITIVIESDRPFNGNEITEEDLKRDLARRRPTQNDNPRWDEPSTWRRFREEEGLKP